MIERMKKVTMMVSEHGRGAFIARLKKAGVLHVRAMKAPDHHEIIFIEDKMARIDRMIRDLEKYRGEKETKEPGSGLEQHILEEADIVAEAMRNKQELKEKERQVRAQLEWFEDWGRFDPKDIEDLRQKGIDVRLYRQRKTEFLKSAEGTVAGVLKEKKGYVSAVVVSRSGDVEPDLDPVVTPDTAPDELEEQLKEAASGIREIEKLLKEKAGRLPAAKACADRLKREHETLNVKFGMMEEGRFSCIQGFCPEKKLGDIKGLAEKHGMGYVFEDPDDPDETPTLITNPKWIRVIDPVFKFMNTLPGYEEFDISFYFLVFFSLFFAMIIGDAGYGLLFLAATFFAQRKMKRLPPEPFYLMYILSAGTVVWGAITGTWFGAEGIARLPFFNGMVIAPIDSFAGDNQDLMIYLCFVIGVTQLSVARALRAIRSINSIVALAEAGWVLILWGMFFAAGKFVLDRPFPETAGWCLLGGIALVLFFSNPRRGILKGAVETLGNLPLSVISSFSDIVSYLRLFAVGYASVVVAESFNNMALAGGTGNIVAALGAAVILFLGHALNITLGLMAVIVHGIRLNMLEFSGHLGMQWSGKKYDPFRERAG
jgi:V/A-type H+/Na+-transporting ATPase subunit I